MKYKAEPSSSTVAAKRMPRGYKRYSDYKDSGVEWLGELPEHWEHKRLKFLCRITTGNKDTENKVDNGEYPFYVRSQTVERINSYSYNGEAILTAGDGVGVGKVFHYVNGRFDYHQRVYMFYSFKHAEGRYLFEYIKNQFYKVALAGEAKSTVDSLRLPLIQNFLIAIPQPKEQKSIANYLNKATAKIDTLIEKQTKLIELLKEKRQAVISSAVTRGLDASVPMKDSGVEWLGKIPEHWDIKKFKYLFRIKKRISGQLGFDVLSITQQGIKVKDIESGQGQLSSDYSKYQHVKKGDFAMNHMDLLTGFVDLSVFDGVTSPDYRVFSLDDKCSNAQFYLFYLQMGYLDKIFYPFGQGSSQLGRWRLPTDAFKEFYAPYPPKEEQELIEKHIRSTLMKIDNLITKSTQAIDLLKEKRAALISAAVTGKIDVRDAA